MYNRYLQNKKARETTAVLQNNPTEHHSAGFENMLSGLLGRKIALADALIYLILLLLYLEKQEEEVLITLAALFVINCNREQEISHLPEQ